MKQLLLTVAAFGFVVVMMQDFWGLKGWPVGITLIVICLGLAGYAYLDMKDD